MSDKAVKLFDDREALRLGVTTKSIDLEALAAAARSIDSTTSKFKEQLTNIELLIDLLSDLQHRGEDPLLKLQKFLASGRDSGELRNLERRLLPLAAVPRAVPRIRILLEAATLEERHVAVRQKLDIFFAYRPGCSSQFASQGCSALRAALHCLECGGIS